jgi:uncharacterized protein (TIGR02757 family)
VIPKNQIQELLDGLVEKFNRPEFIANDPISIPHQFKESREIEIMGLFAAVFAWGQRKTIINKCNTLIELMDGVPLDFILNHSENDLNRFDGFAHRTFNSLDLVHFISFFKKYFSANDSLEALFLSGLQESDSDMGNGIISFRNAFFSKGHEKRTEKHISSPVSGSACKRINMFLRWMVRRDNKGVDFGIWRHIDPSILVCPLDVHVLRVANEFGLLQDSKANWNSAVELTNTLKKYCPEDPVKYDFALFGYGVNGSKF